MTTFTAGDAVTVHAPERDGRPADRNHGREAVVDRPCRCDLCRASGAVPVLVGGEPFAYLPHELRHVTAT